MTRQFTRHVGLPPMKDLNEIRLTEYARLLDETTLPISSAASRVGWIDSRVAASVVSR